MANAISLIRYIFDKLIDLIFNKFYIYQNFQNLGPVTLGWIMVVIILFSIMISNIITIAKATPNLHKDQPSETWGITHYSNGNVTEYYTKRGK